LKQFYYSILIVSVLSLAATAQAQVPAEGQPAPAPPQAPAAAAATPDYLQRGIAFLSDGSYEEAVSDLTRARELSPGSTSAAYYLGSAQKKTQNYTEAVKNLRDAVSLQPVVKEAFLELADVYYQLERYEDSFATLKMSEGAGVEPAQTAYMKGLVLLKQGKNSEALEAFNSAKAKDPALTVSADYQIATAYMQQGKLTEARDLFKDIVVRDPNSELAQFASQYAELLTKRIKEQKPLKVVAAVSYQYDNNVILKPSDSTVAAGISGQRDMSTVATLRAEYAPPSIQAPYGLKAQYSLYLNAYQELKAYDVQSHTLSFVPGYRFGESSASLIASYNYTLVDNKAYLKTMTLSPLYSFTPAAGQFAQASLKYENKDYAGTPITRDENRNGDNIGAGISWFYFLPPQNGFVNVRYELDKENTKGRDWAYLGNRLGASVLYPVTEKIKVTGGMEAYFQKFESEHAILAGRRRDHTYTLNAQVSYALRNNIDVNAQLTHIRDASTLAVYDYSKNILSAGLEARF